jgi:hypothetical protein
VIINVLIAIEKYIIISQLTATLALFTVFYYLSPPEIFLFTTSSRPALATTQSPVQWVLGALTLGVKQPRDEANHSPSSSAKVNNAWSYTSTTPYIFMQ